MNRGHALVCVLFLFVMMGANGQCGEGLPLPPAIQKPPPTEDVVACVPASCNFVCDVSQGNYPMLSKGCTIRDDLVQLPPMTPEVAAWLHAANSAPCTEGNNGQQFFPPQNIVCGGGCTDPSKLPNTCRAVCTVAGDPPVLTGCTESIALVDFQADLEGVTCTGAVPYDIYPDPSLVDTGVCLRVHPPADGHPGGGGAGGGAGAGGAGGDAHGGE